MNDLMMKKSGRRQQIWVYVVALLFFADFVFYGYMPSHRRLQALRASRSQQATMIQAGAAQSKELPALKARLNSVQKLVEHYDAYIPGDASLGVFLKEIADIMDKHRLVDQVVVPGQEVESNGVGCIPVHINCKGSLKNLFGFFRDFQAMERLVRIQRVSLKNDSEYTGQVSLETDAIVFYQLQAPQKSGGQAGPLPGGQNHGA
jgi:Tfp pilus assembly protein PilO